MKWFPHDTDAIRNRKIRKVIRTHGVTGYGIWFAVLEKLYQAEGDFTISADRLWLEDFADDLRITDHRTLIRVFDTFAELGMISSQLWQEHVIYCQAIASRLKFLERIPRRIRKLPLIRRSEKYRVHKDYVFERDGYRCVYCGAFEDLTLDHVIPQSRGGVDEPENLACACKSCNSRKNARTPSEWLGREIRG